MRTARRRDDSLGAAGKKNHSENRVPKSNARCPSLKNTGGILFWRILNNGGMNKREEQGWEGGENDISHESPQGTRQPENVLFRTRWMLMRQPKQTWGFLSFLPEVALILQVDGTVRLMCAYDHFNCPFFLPAPPIRQVRHVCVHVSTTRICTDDTYRYVCVCIRRVFIRYPSVRPPAHRQTTNVARSLCRRRYTGCPMQLDVSPNRDGYSGRAKWKRKLRAEKKLRPR